MVIQRDPDEYLERDAEFVARQRGLHLVKDNPQYLLIDIDTLEQMAQFTKLRQAFTQLAGGEAIFTDKQLKTFSEHGHAHVYIKLSIAYPLQTRLLLQTILGSDPIRSLLDYLRDSYDVPVDSNVLFETTTEYAKVQEFMK